MCFDLAGGGAGRRFRFLSLLMLMLLCAILWAGCDRRWQGFLILGGPRRSLMVSFLHVYYFIHQARDIEFKNLANFFLTFNYFNVQK
jgi:hypothetical protein